MPPPIKTKARVFIYLYGWSGCKSCKGCNGKTFGLKIIKLRTYIQPLQLLQPLKPLQLLITSTTLTTISPCPSHILFRPANVADTAGRNKIRRYGLRRYKTPGHRHSYDTSSWDDCRPSFRRYNFSHRW